MSVAAIFATARSNPITTWSAPRFFFTVACFLASFAMAAPSARADQVAGSRDGVSGAVTGASLSVTAALGEEIFERRRAAVWAVDAFRRAVGDPLVTDVADRVIERAPEGWRATFLAVRDGRVLPVYEVVLSDGVTVSEEVFPATAPEVPWSLRAQFFARQVGLGSALDSPSTFCANDFGLVALPVGDPQAPFAYDIYVMSASTQPSVIVTGGHTRVRVSADRFAVVERQDYTEACLNVARPTDPTLVPTLTRSLFAAPNELEVFLSLMHRTPIFIATPANGRAWLVDGANIESVGENVQ